MMSLNNLTCLDQDQGQPKIILVCLYSFIFILGVILNITALVVFFCFIRLGSHITVYMTNLAVADLMLVLTLPVRIYYHLGYTGLPQWLCESLGLVLKANMYGSIFLLTCISLDRCLAVTFPLSICIREGRKKAPFICLGIWMFTFGVSIPLYLIKRKTSPQNNCFNSLPIYSMEHWVAFTTLFVGFGIPLLVMLLCSLGLVRAVRRSHAAQTKLVDSHKIQRMIFVSVLIFFFSFLPYHVSLCVLTKYKETISCQMVIAYRYSLMLACLNTVLDPIAYYFTTNTFRMKLDISAFQRIFTLNSQS